MSRHGWRGQGARRRKGVVANGTKRCSCAHSGRRSTSASTHGSDSAQWDLQNAPVRRQRACLRRVNAVRLLPSWMSAAMAACAAASACPPLRAPRLPACRAAAASAPLAEPRSALRLKTCLWRPSGAQLLHSVRSKQRSSARRCRLRAAASLLSPNDAWTVWAVLLSTSALGIWRVCRAASSCVVGLPLTMS